MEDIQDAKMNSLIDKAVERYCYLYEEDEKSSDEFKKKCQKYITFYNFLIQIYPIKNLNLLRLQVYLLVFLRKLPKKGADISLYNGEDELVRISETATSRISEDDEEYLEDIIQKINDVLGVGLTEEDSIIIDQYEEMFKNNRYSLFFKGVTKMLHP